MRWLIDEMLPAALAAELNGLGHDAVSLHDVNLAGASDDEVYGFAVASRRATVTENFADYARIVERRHARAEPCQPVVFVRKRDFPRGGGLAMHLGRHLHLWATENPDPYPGLHWP